MPDSEVYFSKVHADYATYEAFADAHKIAEKSPVDLTQAAPNVEHIGKTEVHFGWVGFACEFVATKSPKTRLKYALKLTAKHFSDKPCFRFCSGGSTHVNEEMGSGLPGRIVPAPHFHRIDKRGILYAYQTPPLIDPVERENIVSTPQLGTNLFCQESKLFSPNGGFVVLKIWATEFDWSTADPLRDATFPR
jgi:hypothetical protein